MTQDFQRFTERYANVLWVFIGGAVVSSILLYSGCGMSGGRAGIPNPTPTPDRTPPTSAITSPASGATVLTRVPVSVTGTASDTGGGAVARVEVSVDGGATFSPATGTTSWSFNWTPATAGQATIRSRAVDGSGNVQDPPAQITVTVIQDTTPPISTITSPKTGADIFPGTTSINGTASDAGGGSVARVEVSVDGGATFSAATGTTSWSFNWAPATPGRGLIRSRAVDNSGNVQNSTPQIIVNIVVGVTWTSQGPGPILNGQVEKVSPNNEVVGGINTVAAHPTDANVLYVGGVNGGVWRTGNAKAERPHWTPLTDNLPSLSIGALEFDPTDPTNRTLIAGIGRWFNGFNRDIGPLTGALRTTDGGENWTQINHPLLVNQHIIGVAARGDTLLATTVRAGVVGSTDGGINWNQVSGGNGIILSPAYDLVGDPNNLNRFYVYIVRIGIFRSDDRGATWTNISSGDPILNGLITPETNGSVEMAVAGNGRLYVVVVNSGQASYIGFTDNPAESVPAWTAMDLPRTRESDGKTEGIHPGGDRFLHLSIAVDPSDPNIVYVGGDRQPGPLPNFIGAGKFSGRLFRGDTRVAPTGEPPSPQWEHLTHSNSITQIPGGGTASGSAPHAGSRDMVIDASGDVIEVDEGGIYRRTSPRDNTGDWFSINGDIQTTEFHDVAYDTNSNIILGGAQGAGSSQQITTGSTTWRSVSGGGGDVAVDNITSDNCGCDPPEARGDVAVDNITLAANNQSIRYSSSLDLGFRRETYDAANIRIGDPIFPPLTVVSGEPLQPRHVNLMELNSINPTRLVIGRSSQFNGGLNIVYESLDQGDTITQINGPGGIPYKPFAMAYGGRSGGVDNPEVLYVCGQIVTSTEVGPTVLLRTIAGADLEQTAELPTDAFEARDVVMDSDEWRSAYVVVDNQVFRTTDAGASWTDITGNLPALGAGDFNTIVFVAGDSRDLLLVGTNAGVFVSFSDSGFTRWNKLGAGLPNALVWDLDYDVADDVLVAGTLGRGAWTITNLRGLTGQTAQP